MAFIATYISTVSGGSELSSYFEEIAEWSATADVTAHELAIKESYDYVNSFLDAYLSIPIQKEPTTGRYNPLVRWAQAKTAIAMCRERKQGSTSEDVIKSWESAMQAIKAMVEARAQLEIQNSPDEVGIGDAVPGASNTSAPRLVTNRTIDFTGDREMIYTITITTGGAVGTAVYSWSDGEGNTDTANTTAYAWQDLENGIEIRQFGSGSFVLNDTWTIRCVPVGSIVTTASGGIGNIEVRK
jgi:hypothetical protein